MHVPAHFWLEVINRGAWEREGRSTTIFGIQAISRPMLIQSSITSSVTT